MMNEDDIRDRIEEVIYREDTPRQNAEAVMDELGLTVEHWFAYSNAHFSRVVGEWEKND